MFFLARFINVHNDDTQAFWVEVSQQIETGKQPPNSDSRVNDAHTVCIGLFSLTSIGLMPFRIVDTYRMSDAFFSSCFTELQCRGV